MKNVQLSGTENVFIEEDELGMYELVFHRGLNTVRYPIEHALLILEFIKEHEDEIISEMWRQNV